MQIVENQSQVDFLSYEIRFNSDCKDLLHSPFGQRTLACIPPRHRQIVLIMEWNDTRDHTTGVSYQQSLHHERNAFDPIPNINRSQRHLHSPRPIHA